ncbi:MAG: nucleotide-binding protein [Gammaproteobacteria bacterium]|nr:nucleotide-binding protein [Gammaproteobacteria bacterium]MBU1480199.1 nucleotide-binding protein [Gammaproteobacteria bacterium]
MKALLAICMLFFSTLVIASETPATMPPAAMPTAPAVSMTGKVLEVKDVDSYTFLRLKTRDGELWAAVMTAKVRKGSTVTVENGVVMNNFHSKALNKTFPTILFGTLGSATAMAPTGHGLGTAYPLVPGKKLETINEAPVAKASGANAYTVSEIVTSSADLKDKTVQLRGRVVKFNPSIMGKNWIHLRDGSGSATDDTNDILVTSQSETRVGDVVTVKGTVRTDKDFGSGYAYKVLIEEATLE